MEWIMALLGISIDFLARYSARRKKTQFSFTYWVKDNWVETVQSLILLAALMLFVTHSDFSIEPEKFQEWLGTFLPLPDGILFPMALFVPFIVGLFVNQLVYFLNKRKEKWAAKKLEDN